MEPINFLAYKKAKEIVARELELKGHTQGLWAWYGWVRHCKGYNGEAVLPKKSKRKSKVL